MHSELKLIFSLHYNMRNTRYCTKKNTMHCTKKNKKENTREWFFLPMGEFFFGTIKNFIDT